MLNEGQLTLRDKYGWNIIAVKDIYKEALSKYGLIIVDEAQRIYGMQLNHIIREVKKNYSNCIFSHDGQQTLWRGEITNKIEDKIELEITQKSFELTTKIRTNKEVAAFIHCLFDKGRPIERYGYSSIELKYFDNYRDAAEHLVNLRAIGWKTINYTPSKKYRLPYENHSVFNETDNAHTVIGQEFDNVAAAIDGHFYFKERRLTTRNYKNRPYYHPTKMLFQILSRTRIRLNVVIIKNEEVLARCLAIINCTKSE
ncbi:MAG: DUF2075 domain-containing protein [Flavobacterium sp.]|nr:MAG: DUF2075 domain-containing protein [Flavobacterium sp.]